MKKLCIVPLVVILCFISANSAEAHYSKRSGSITAEFHVNPNDSPTLGTNSTLIFEFEDESGKLDITQCECVLTIMKDGQSIESKKISDKDVTRTVDSLSFPYSFEEKGEYDLKLTGAPISGAAFQSFEFEYDVSTLTPGSILKYVGAHSFAGHSLHYIFFGAAILISLYFIITDKGDRPGASV